MKNVMYTIGGLIGIGLLIFALQVTGMVSKSFFGKWDEQIRHDIQKESQAYRDGMMRNLGQMMVQYSNSDVGGKEAIKAAVRQQYSQVDTSEYPAYLKNFLSDVGVY